MKISIIGAAGTLGSCAAFNIIIHRMAAELVLIDPWKDMLKAHYMDLTTAITWQHIDVKMGEYPDLAESDIVVITAGAPPAGQITSRRELLPGNLPVVQENIQKINQYCPDATIITATNPVDPLNYATYLLSAKKDRRKIIGYSLNDTFRFRSISAELLGVRPSRVQGMVLGEHDESQVPVFSSLQQDHRPVTVDEAFKSKVREKAARVLQDLESLRPKRATGWTSAVGIVAIIRSIINDVGEVIPCNSVLQGEYGFSNLSMTVPCVLCKEGIERIQEIPLNDEEKAGLQLSAQTLRPYMQYVEERLGLKPSDSLVLNPK
jgi:malate dehydrogenase